MHFVKISKKFNSFEAAVVVVDVVVVAAALSHVISAARDSCHRRRPCRSLSLDRRVVVVVHSKFKRWYR